jgi:predicted nuclease with TOPRIM domain
VVADAEASAKSILESAREDTQRLEADERGRQEALRTETQRLEEGRRQALDGVRELTAILEELLEGTHEPRGPTLDETLGDRRTLGRRSG